jgi:hypothetical protein
MNTVTTGVMNEVDVVCACFYRKYQIMKRIYWNNLYYFRVYMFNRLNNNSEYIL